MIYEANTIEWKPGDIVIHDADSKDHKMLMVVRGIIRYRNEDTAQWQSQYLNPEELIPHCVMVKYGSYERIPKRLTKQSREIWLNDMKYLHNPARFGIEINEADKQKAKEIII